MMLKKHKSQHVSKKILKITLASTLCCSFFVATPNFVAAESLWSVTNKNIAVDRKAREVGDILTIIIQESTTTSATKSTSNSKSGNQNLGAGTGPFSFLMSATASASDSFKAAGALKDTNSVNARLTVTVTELQPNGNMVIEGTQSIWQNNNEHKITIRGVVRRDDVSANNTVYSNQVADATLKFDGKGPLNAKQRQGILTQIFNILF